jgi:hypothetical protein
MILVKMMTSTQQPAEGSHDTIFADFASLLVARAQGKAATGPATCNEKFSEINNQLNFANVPRSKTHAEVEKVKVQANSLRAHFKGTRPNQIRIVWIGAL